MKESFAEALPYLRTILIIFGGIVLLVNLVSWSELRDFARWPWVIMTSIFFFMAHEKGIRNQNIQFSFFWAAGLTTGLWI